MQYLIHYWIIPLEGSDVLLPVQTKRQNTGKADSSHYGCFYDYRQVSNIRRTLVGN